MKLRPVSYSLYLHLLAAVFFLHLKVNAQSEHFIYIQAYGQQTFKAAVNGKTFNSSSIGYLIIPELKDSVYNLGIDLSGDSVARLNFPVTVNKKDAGYLLKNYGAKGWGLFNLETMNIIMEGKASQKNSADSAKTNAKNTDFGDMLSDVVNDSTLNKIPKDSSREGKLVATQTSSSIKQGTDTGTQVKFVDKLSPDSSQEGASLATVQTINSITNSAVEKVVQNSTDTGTQVKFVDLNNGNADTVNIFIPATETSLSNGDPTNTSRGGVNAKDSSASPNNVTENGVKDSIIANGGGKMGNPFYSSGDSNGTTSTAISMAGQLTNSNCKKMATDADLDKLRKKIIEETDANEMIVLAKKILKGKCVTTSQVKNIGDLFLSDEGRYDFYEAMYNSTYDYGNYATLQSQLIDSYYKKRFQTMLR